METKTRSISLLAPALTALALILTSYQPAKAGSFLPAGFLNTPHTQATATLLPNGKVLVAGGYGSPGVSPSAELYDPTSGTWTPTGPMITERWGHTATLLPNGKVLVAGGYGNRLGPGSALRSAELFDPATATWTPTTPMANARLSHTATLLTDGKVLVAGGFGGFGAYPSSAELYDPATGLWTLAGTMNVGRENPTATLLPNGKVLVAGGWGFAVGYLASAELYDPATRAWTATAGMTTPRYLHTATLLPNGRAFVTGGTYIDTAEVYDLATGTWTAIANPMTASRQSHTATLLPNGKLLITGGRDATNGTNSFSSAELYDPATGLWTPTDSMNVARAWATATLLPSGKVLVVGGSNSNSLDTAELYDPAFGRWSATSALAVPREVSATTLLPNGKVLVAGGYSRATGAISSAELYDPATRTWAAATQMNAPRSQATATLLPSGKVLLAGGYYSNSLNSAELYDPATGMSTVTGNMTDPREVHTATLLPNGKVLVAGGIGQGVLSSAELYDPATGTWNSAGAMTHARYAHTATLLPSGNVLVAGGYSSFSEDLSSVDLYDPLTGKWAATGSLNTARGGYHTATLLPNGKVLIAAGVQNNRLLPNAELYDPATGMWTEASPLNTARYFHTATLLRDGRVLVGGGAGSSPFSSSAELYDPATGTWTPTDPLVTGRQWHSAALLPNGQVLLVGGSGYAGDLASAELYDVGLDFSPDWQPQIHTLTSPLTLGNSLMLAGSGFRGLSEASSGNSQTSPTDYPVLQLRSLEGGQTLFLPSTNWSATSLTSSPVSGLPPGWTLATVFVNGIPSTASILNLTAPVPPTNSPPIALCRNVTKPADANCQAALDPQEVDNGSTDPDGDPVTLTLSPAGPYPLGITPVTLTVADNHGLTNSCTASITVIDTQPPQVVCWVRQPELWPPNHKLANVGLSVGVADNCAPRVPRVTIRIFSNEADAAPARGAAFSPDAADIAPGALKLRQERKDGSNGRVYLIVVSANDTSGNSGVDCCTVIVPANRSTKAIAAANAQATAAKEYCLSHNGVRPPGYYAVSVGPFAGPPKKLAGNPF